MDVQQARSEFDVARRALAEAKLRLALVDLDNEDRTLLDALQQHVEDARKVLHEVEIEALKALLEKRDADQSILEDSNIIAELKAQIRQDAEELVTGGVSLDWIGHHDSVSLHKAFFAIEDADLRKKAVSFGVLCRKYFSDTGRPSYKLGADGVDVVELWSRLEKELSSREKVEEVL